MLVEGSRVASRYLKAGPYKYGTGTWWLMSGSIFFTSCKFYTDKIKTYKRGWHAKSWSLGKTTNLPVRKQRGKFSESGFAPNHVNDV